MRIGIDIDDTITNSWEYFIPIYSQVFDIPVEKLQKSKPYYESIKDNYTLDEYFYLLKPIYDERISEIPLKENVKEVIDKLYDLGHSVTFITARSKDHTDPYEASKKYLDKHHIKYDKLIVRADKKDEVCLKEKIDLFIDDSIKHCQSVTNTGIEVIMFETAYNKDIKDIKHLKSWEEIYEYIKSR